MTTKAEQDAAAQARAAEIEQARAAAKAEGATEGEAKGKTDGAKAERDRVRGILASEEAKGRDKLALHLAMETDTDVEAAKKLLGAAPKEAGTSFAAAMAALGNPKVGADAPDTKTEHAPINTGSIYASRAAARETAK